MRVRSKLGTGRQHLAMLREALPFGSTLGPLLLTRLRLGTLQDAPDADAGGLGAEPAVPEEVAEKAPSSQLRQLAHRHCGVSALRCVLSCMPQQVRALRLASV